MTLPLDAIVQKAITTSTNLATMIPEKWTQELEPNLRKRAVLQQALTEFTELEGTSGDILHVPDLPDLGAAAAIAEGTDITVANLSNSAEVQLTPSEVAKGIGITRFAIDRLGYDGMSAIVERLAYSMSQYIESTIAGLWNSAVPTKGGTFSTQYPGGHATGTIVAGDVLSSAVIRTGVATMQSLDVMPFDDGTYMLFISPLSYGKLLADQDVRNDLRYGNTAPLFRGEVGVYANCRIILTNYLKTGAEGAANGVPTWKNLLVAPRWAAVAWKRRPEVVIDPTLLDFGRRRQVAVISDLHIASLHTERALVLVTAQ